jgi:hypothetical protein
VNNQATQLTASQQQQDNLNIGSCGDHRGDVAADVTTAQKDTGNSQLKQRNRPAITIQAFAGKPAVSSNQTSPTSSDSGSVSIRTTSRASSSSDGGSSAASCTTQATIGLNSYSRSLFRAAVMLLCRIVLLQLAYAVLLGLSGSTCPLPMDHSAAAAAAAQQDHLESACLNPRHPGSCDSSSNGVMTTYSLSSGVSVASLISWFSSTFPLLACHIYAFVAGMLVPVQLK